MKARYCLSLLCLLILCWTVPATADKSNSGHGPGPGPAGSGNAGRQPDLVLNPPAALAVPDLILADTSPAMIGREYIISDLMLRQEFSPYKLTLSDNWLLVGDYRSYSGWANPLLSAEVDKSEAYAVYHLRSQGHLSPYLRFGSDWVRQRDFFLRADQPNRTNDLVGLHAGGGLKVGPGKLMALDYDFKYGVAADNRSLQDNAWGGSVGVRFYIK